MSSKSLDRKDSVFEPRRMKFRLPVLRTGGTESTGSLFETTTHWNARLKTYGTLTV